jgi:transcriptional regulator with XRE-family HTH domain
MAMTASAATPEGRMIRAARVLRGWSQADLARAARVSRSTVTRIECGGSVLGATRVAIATALGVDLSAHPEPADA